jgi:hypothetical protein
MNDSKLDRLIQNVTFEHLPRLKLVMQKQRLLVSCQVAVIALQLAGLIAIGVLIWRLG